MKPVVLNKENFEDVVLKSDKPVLVDFYADWCGPCKMIAPMIDEIAEEMVDKALVCKVNVDDARDLAIEFKVATIPTLMVFKDGKRTQTVVGARPKPDIKALLD